ncbi:MAG: ABC transporter substrate-binding protein [Gammaproteobacteria bacterium]|nr:ABC transporter substrate-binding protein [Gammaproteobacteria bacterium]
MIAIVRRLILFPVLLVLLLSSCSSPQSDTIRFGLASMPANVDPRYATDAASTRIGRLIFERLVDFNEKMLPIPALADWQQQSPTHYVFTLRHASRFHHGGALTSRDIKATYEYILNEKNASPHRGSLSIIQEIRAPNEQTIEFILTRPDPLFPAYLVIGILPADLQAKDHRFEREPVGSGPFRFVDWPEEGRLRLQRSADKQNVEFINVPNPTVRVLKLMRGELDIMQNDIPPELINYLVKNHDVNIQHSKGANYAYLGFNLEDPILGRLEVRQAIAHGINRDEIIHYVFGDSARVANALLPPTHWAGHNNLVSYQYDPQKARQLLQQAGVKLPLELSYKTSNDPFRIRIATILQSQMEQIGVHVNIQSYDWGTFYGDIKSGRFQLFSLAWVGIKTPDIYRYVFHSASTPPDGANRGRFTDKEIDQLIEEAEKFSDLQKQAEVYRRLQEKIHANLPYVPLWYEDNVLISRKNISNYRLPVDGDYDGLILANKTP